MGGIGREVVPHGVVVPREVILGVIVPGVVVPDLRRQFTQLCGNKPINYWQQTRKYVDTEQEAETSTFCQGCAKITLFETYFSWQSTKITLKLRPFTSTKFLVQDLSFGLGTV